jgi:hypothetical protein
MGKVSEEKTEKAEIIFEKTLSKNAIILKEIEIFMKMFWKW